MAFRYDNQNEKEANDSHAVLLNILPKTSLVLLLHAASRRGYYNCKYGTGSIHFLVHCNVQHGNKWDTISSCFCFRVEYRLLSTYTVPC